MFINLIYFSLGGNSQQSYSLKENSLQPSNIWSCKWGSTNES